MLTIRQIYYIIIIIIPGYGTKNTVLWSDSVTAEVESPVHGEEYVVVDDVWGVVSPGLGGVQGDVNDFSYAKTTTPVRPDHLQKQEQQPHLRKP